MNPDPVNPLPPDPEARITAFLLGELSPAESAEVQHELEANPSLARLHADLKHTIDLVREAALQTPTEATAPSAQPRLSPDRRNMLLGAFKTTGFPVPPKPQRTGWSQGFKIAAAVIVIGVIAIGAFVPSLAKAKAKGQSLKYAATQLQQAQVAVRSEALQEQRKDVAGAERERFLALTTSEADAKPGQATAAGNMEPQLARRYGLATTPEGRTGGRAGEVRQPGAPVPPAAGSAALRDPVSAAATPAEPAPTKAKKGIVATGKPPVAGTAFGGYESAGRPLQPARQITNGQLGVAWQDRDDSGNWQFSGGIGGGGKADVNAGLATGAHPAPSPTTSRPVLLGAAVEANLSANSVANDAVRGPSTLNRSAGRSADSLGRSVQSSVAADGQALVLGDMPVLGQQLKSLADDKSRLMEPTSLPSGPPNALAPLHAPEPVVIREKLAKAEAKSDKKRPALPDGWTASQSLSDSEIESASQTITWFLEEARKESSGEEEEPRLINMHGTTGTYHLERTNRPGPAPRLEALGLVDTAAVAPARKAASRQASRVTSFDFGYVGMQGGSAAPLPEGLPTGHKSKEATLAELGLEARKERDESGIDAESKVTALQISASAVPVPAIATEPPAPVVAPKAAPVAQPEVPTAQNPFSTFSLNVTDVSFRLAASDLENGRMPDPAGVRCEEFINAFNYRDPAPAPGVPIALAWEQARYPFAHNRDLLRFSVQTAAQGRDRGQPLNLVILLDNSGSMERADRVATLREALKVLASQLQPQDRISLVTFARMPQLRLDGIEGSEAQRLAEQAGALTPEGGTNLEEALRLGYDTALRHFLSPGVNRVILLTDGAANLGEVSPQSLQRQVEEHRSRGVALDCFGIGWEGYNDDLLEVLSRHGDGRYGFINTPEDAATGFAHQLAGALQVAAADVKVQIEFNPRRVTSWRQVGYAKHQLTQEQFRDNTVDAAELGAAESGNAVYVVETNPQGEGPLGTVRVRYRVPATGQYHEHEWEMTAPSAALPLEQSSPALRLAGVAAAFSEWLASTPFAGEVTPDRLLALMNGIPEAFTPDPRPTQLQWMIRQAKAVSGK